jgi:hypothetical protein
MSLRWFSGDLMGMPVAGSVQHEEIMLRLQAQPELAELERCLRLILADVAEGARADDALLDTLPRPRGLVRPSCLYALSYLWIVDTHNH